MPLYLVTYDLNGDNPDYGPIIEKIESYANKKIMKNTWAVESKKHAREIRDDINTVISKDDFVFVTPITKESAWGIPTSIHEWILERR